VGNNGIKVTEKKIKRIRDWMDVPGKYFPGAKNSISDVELKNKGYIIVYSIARALSYGMNIVFAKQNYIYGGRLINNCNIMGKFEDMNIWFKEL